MSNVSLDSSPKDRVKTLRALIKTVMDDMDNLALDRDNPSRFLLHVAWHEGRRLETREQDGGGPGRSFFQFEPLRAKEVVEYANQKGWLDKLVAAADSNIQEILTAAGNLPTSGSTWPSNNLIEKFLGKSPFTSDLFATYLARIAFKKIPQSVPGGNDNHAIYWAEHWKRKFSPPEDRARQIAVFTKAADAVDKILNSL
jgi:hypothetical protein